MRYSAALGILLMVQILFVISILSLLVLVGAAAAIVHHVRSSRQSQAPPPEPSFSDHLYSAAEYGTPRSARLVPHQSVQSITAKKDLDPAPKSHDGNATSQRRSLHIVPRPPVDQHSPTQLDHVNVGARTASSKRF